MRDSIPHYEEIDVTDDAFFEPDYTAAPDRLTPVAEVIEAEQFMVEFKPAKVDAMTIVNLKAKFGALTIRGLDDKKGYDMVHAARMEVKDYRVAVEKRRKELKAEHLAYGRKVDAGAKYITNLLWEIEEPLAKLENTIDQERERIKAAKQAEAAAKLQGRIDALAAVGGVISIAELTMMSDMVYDSLLKTATDAFQAREAIRLQQEAQAAAYAQAQAQEAADKAQAEAQAIADERARMAAEAAELKAARAQMEQDKKALEVEVVTVKKAKEPVLTDAEKLHVLALQIQRITQPEMTTDAGKQALAEIAAATTRFVAFIHAKADSVEEFKV